MSNEQEIFIPVEQASVLFFGQPVIAIRLSDGRIGAIVSNICSILQMDAASQVRRIREDETIADCRVQESDWEQLERWFKLQMERGKKKS